MSGPVSGWRQGAFGLEALAAVAACSIAGPARLELPQMALSRRQFMIRGGQLAAASAAGGLWSLDRLAAPARGGGGLRKCISLGGPGPLREEGHPDDYRLWGNREYIRDASGTSWVKLWVSWYDLQQEIGFSPANRAESWRHLQGAPGGQGWLRRLDRQVRAANEDRVGVILSVHHAHPTWASGATGPDPVDPSKPAEQKLPLDVSPDSPWGWFVAYLIARYRKGSSANPVGPQDAFGQTGAGHDPLFGNPELAAIEALEICNEPNYLGWPQDGVVQTTAEMIRSATLLSAAWGGTPILAPATSDFPDTTTGNSRGVTATVWSDFTQGVLAALAGYRPTVPLRWSHHNYRDVRLGTSRAEQVLAMLRGAGWRSDVAPLWLTEGGLNLGAHAGDPAQRGVQAASIDRSFRRTMQLSDVYLWTQHTISDKAGNDFKSGLRDDFDASRGPGPERPSWSTWRDLPGASTP
jgi:hypothetical protein